MCREKRQFEREDEMGLVDRTKYTDLLRFKLYVRYIKHTRRRMKLQKQTSEVVSLNRFLMYDHGQYEQTTTPRYLIH